MKNTWSTLCNKLDFVLFWGCKCKTIYKFAWDFLAPGGGLWTCKIPMPFLIPIERQIMNTLAEKEEWGAAFHPLKTCIKASSHRMAGESSFII